MDDNTPEHELLDTTEFVRWADSEPDRWCTAVNRRVFHKAFGNGRIAAIESPRGYPEYVAVTFQDQETKTFTLATFANPSFFKSIATALPEPPESKESQRTPLDGVHEPNRRIDTTLPDKKASAVAVSPSLQSQTNGVQKAVEPERLPVSAHKKNVAYTIPKPKKMVAELHPSSEQQIIIAALPESHQMVTAGPGTGKTFTLIERVRYLIEEHGLSPGEELLVLSFSRSAVYEVKQRVAQAQGDIRYVQSFTFDSFATQLLMELRPSDDLTPLDYEQRIVRATKLLNEIDEPPTRLAVLRHLFVDEVQDLIGARASFVLAILNQLRSGFTLLGDPAQGIYTFQLPDAERRDGARAFYQQVRVHFHRTLIERALTTNHRAQDGNAKIALWAGPELNGARPNYESIRLKLTKSMKSLPKKEVTRRDIDKPLSLSQTVAFLFRTNGQVLMASRDFWDKGLPHRLQRSATERVAPAWLAAALLGVQKLRVSRRELIERLGRVSLPDELSTETAYDLLYRAAPDGRDAVNLTRLANKIRSGSLPDWLLDAQTDSIVLSTVHRAKGMEFDRVVLPTPWSSSKDDEEAEEARVLYVAMTRPKQQLLRIQMPSTRGCWKHDDSNRWVRTYKQFLNDIEFQGDDLHAADPAGGFLIDDASVLELQNYLLDSVKPGDPVILVRSVQSTERGARVFYIVQHNKTSIGVTSEWFGSTLYGALVGVGRRSIRRPVRNLWPQEITGLRIEGVQTIAGTPITSRKLGLGEAGLWLRPRLVGMGTLHRE